MKYKYFIIAFLIIFKSFAQDKDLNYFIEKAQKNSPLLLDLKNQMRSNVLDSLIVRATYKPQIAANALAYYAPLVDSIGYDSAVTNGRTLSAFVGVRKNIVQKSIVNDQ